MSNDQTRQERRLAQRKRALMKRRIAIFLPLVALAALVIGLIAGGADTDDAPAESGPTKAQIEARKKRQLAREDAAIDRILEYTTFIQRGGGKKREVALTFDDGPSPYTEDILRILKRMKVKATFFAVGTSIPGNEKTIQKLVRQGHAVGNHTEDHPPMGDLDAASQVVQLNEQSQKMAAANGPEQRLFRPPYRSFNGSTLELLRERDYLMVLWDVDTGDYEGLGAETIVDRALADVKPGSIILMHDGGGDRSATVAALPDIIKGLRKRNLTPVTVPRLALDDPPADGVPLPEGLTGS
ncbi:MAG: polysaccharide deacetylase family protein [Solirubrobacterales bacterium]